MKTLRYPCSGKREHTLLVNSLQCGNIREEDEVALSSAQQSPSVTSRSAVFMERAALKPDYWSSREHRSLCK